MYVKVKETGRILFLETKCNYLDDLMGLLEDEGKVTYDEIDEIYVVEEKNAEWLRTKLLESKEYKIEKES